MLSVNLPQDVERRLGDFAKKHGRSTDYYARLAILEFLEDMEDSQLAMERLSITDKVWTQKEIEEELGVAH